MEDTSAVVPGGNLAPGAAGALRGPVTGVLFDLDDTLYNRRTTFSVWSDTFLRDCIGIVDGAERKGVITWMETLDNNGYGSKHNVIVELCRRFPEAGGSVEGFYDEFVDRVAYDPEAVQLLDHLDACGLPYGVITNGTARQQRKIDALGLAARTNTILISDIFGAKKPDPSIFLAAAGSIGISPVDILFIGDHPVNDIEGARSVGMLTAWIRRGQPWPVEKTPADLQVDSLDQLIPYLGITQE